MTRTKKTRRRCTLWAAALVALAGGVALPASAQDGPPAGAKPTDSQADPLHALQEFAARFGSGVSIRSLSGGAPLVKRGLHRRRYEIEVGDTPADGLIVLLAEVYVKRQDVHIERLEIKPVEPSQPGPTGRSQPHRLVAVIAIDAVASDPAEPAPDPAAAAASAGPVADALERLRASLGTRDEAGIAAIERELVALGADHREALAAAHASERQFQVKVSLEHVVRTIEGRSGARHVLPDMRATSDAAETMRLAFLLLKSGPEDVPAIEAALASKEDETFVRKYLVRALGGMPEGAGGLEVLAAIARSDDDPAIRTEATRALERRSTRDTSGLRKAPTICLPSLFLERYRSPEGTEEATRSAESHDIEHDGGSAIRLGSMDPKGPLSKYLGLEPGDIVVSVNGARISKAKLAALWQDLKDESALRVEVEIDRRGERILVVYEVR